MPKSSKSSSDTTVTTTTTTSIGDIGLTGQNALDAIALMEAGAIEREKISTERVSQLTDFSLSLVERNQKNALDFAQTGEDETDLIKMMPYIVAIVASAAPLIFVKR